MINFFVKANQGVPTIRHQGVRFETYERNVGSVIYPYDWCDYYRDQLQRNDNIFTFLTAGYSSHD